MIHVLVSGILLLEVSIALASKSGVLKCCCCHMGITFSMGLLEVLTFRIH